MINILLIIGLILGLVLEPICDAIQDTLDHHQGQSIFSNKKRFKNQLWWNSNQGWRNKYIDRDPKKGRVKWNILGFETNKPVQFTDGWHFFKSLKLIFSISAQAILPSLFLLTDYWWVGLVSVLVMGMSRNSVFTLFYHKLLMK